MPNDNKALLAKQGWRLLQNGESLLARVLRARYFPRGDFLSASIGYNSSYTWQSILEGRKVLDVGLIWVVGNGHTVKFWKDRWLFGDGRVLSTQGNLPDNWRVRELMEPDYSRWNAALIHQLFTPAEALKIMAMPFSVQRGGVM